ncbi:MAG: NACHT domain-containing protein, partial [bacterium]|nr:NACHT domain-containing protein [bacterium]
NPFHKPGKEELLKEGKIDKKGDPGEPGTAEESKEPPLIDIEKLLERKACVLVRGGAGTGKTTLIKHLAYTITQRQGPPSLSGYLPVMVFLNDIWPIYESQGRHTAVTFQELLKTYLETPDSTLEIGVVENFLAQGRALLLLDGLDEVPRHLRDNLVKLVAKFRDKRINNRFLLTGRPHGISGIVRKHFGQYLHDI